MDKDGFAHSYNDEPSNIFNYNTGEKRLTYRKHGRMHRLTGPTLIDFSSDGSIRLKRYYIENKELSQEQWEIEVNRLNLLSELIS